MKIIALGIIGGIIGATLGCQVVDHAKAAPVKWDGCSQRMVHAGEYGMVRVHDCNNN